VKSKVTEGHIAQVSLDPDSLMRRAFAFKLSRKRMKQYAREHGAMRERSSLVCVSYTGAE